MARIQAKKLSEMLEKKTLEAHNDKTGLLILGSKKFKTKIESELRDNPINFSKFELKTKSEDKYLGQIIKCDLSTSAFATVQDRMGKLKGAAIEIKAIIEDFKMQAMGGLVAAWELWERALVPSLLSGAGTWLGDIREAVKLCNTIQAFYWQVVPSLHSDHLSQV